MDELFKAAQRADAGACMNGADPARMARAPCFEQVEGFRSAHLADRDAVGAQAQRGPDQIGKRRHAVFRPHGDKIGRGALQFAGVLDDDDAILRLRHLGEQRVSQRGLAGAGAARHQDIGAGGDGFAQRFRLIGGHDARRHIVVEREHRDGGFADGEGRGGDHGRQQTLEPLPALWQFGRDAGAAGMNLRADMMRDQPHDAFAIGGGQAFARVGKPFGQPVHPKATVRVQHYLDHGRVFEQPGNGGAERGAQHARAARDGFRFLVVGGHVGPVSSWGATGNPQIGVD